MDDDFVSLMDDSGETRDDLKCPDSGEVGDAIRSAIDNEQDILVSIFLLLISFHCMMNSLSQTCTELI